MRNHFYLAISHLLPSVNTMAISTKQFDILGIFFPIRKPAHKVVTAFCVMGFPASVYVIDIKNANISIPALHAFPAKFFNKAYLPFPIPLYFSTAITIFVPVTFLAFTTAKFGFCWFSAKRTFPGVPPPCSMIASNTAIFNTGFSTIGFAKRNAKNLMTIFASKFDSVFSHTSTIPQLPINLQAIAERRIKDAQAQPLLFEVNK